MIRFERGRGVVVNYFDWFHNVDTDWDDAALPTACYCVSQKRSQPLKDRLSYLLFEKYAMFAYKHNRVGRLLHGLRCSSNCPYGYFDIHHDIILDVLNEKNSEPVGVPVYRPTPNRECTICEADLKRREAVK